MKFYLHVVRGQIYLQFRLFESLGRCPHDPILGKDTSYRCIDPFPLGSSIVLDFHMQIEGQFRSILLFAIRIQTLKILL